MKYHKEGYKVFDLVDCNVKIGHENCFKSIIGNHNLHHETNDNGLGLIDLTTEKKNLRMYHDFV